MRKFLFVFVLLLTAIVSGQEKGTVVGVVTDKEMNNEALPFANVFVKGTTIGVTTDFDGNYTLSLDPGNWTVVFSFVGYQTIEASVTVVSGQTITINQAIGASEGITMDEVVVTAQTTKESATALIAEQKKATVIVESIGAQQLSNQGVSDAAAATTKVTGVSKQQGSSKVYVRGLGDRYNSTTLNGLPLPSNDPSLKNISLDLFSTDMLQNVGISKTFSSSLTADVGGANINIQTKQAVNKPAFSIGVSTGINSQTTFEDFRTIDGANYLGIASEVNHPISDLSSYEFTDNFSPNENTAKPNIGISINGGNRFDFENGTSLSFFLVGSFSNSSRFKEGFNTNNLDENRKGSAFDSAKEYDYSTSKLAMGNFKFRINTDHNLFFNSLFIHSNSQKIQDFLGSSPDVENLNVVLQTQNQNRLFVNQLISKNKFGEYIDLDLSVAYNNIKNDEPNRKKNKFIIDEVNGDRFSTGTARNNSRYFHNLNEDDITAQVLGKFHLGERYDEDTKGFIDFGYQFRNITRKFEAIYFDHDRIGSTKIVDRNDISSFLNQDGIDNNEFRLVTGYGFGSTALNPFTYGGTKISYAVNAAINYTFLKKLNVNIGARFEDVAMDVNWETNLSRGKRGTSLDKTYVLPSLNVKYTISEEHQARLSFSKTYTYPQFKEVAEFVYEGVNYQDKGNSSLQPSDNYNLDVKYEYFPEEGGLISGTIFGKLIQNSINRIELNSAADNFYSYDNTGNATVYGVELEFKKDVYSFGDDDEFDANNIKVGANVTYMITEQEFNTTPQFKPTNETSQLEGAAPLIINADVSYNLKKDDKETVASVVFNYQDDKLYSIGNNFGGVGLANIVQKSITTIDIIAKHQFNKRLGLKLSVKNLLNPDIKRVRDLSSGEITNVSFKRGVDSSLSLTYKF